MNYLYQLWLRRILVNNLKFSWADREEILLFKIGKKKKKKRKQLQAEKMLQRPAHVRNVYSNKLVNGW